MTGVSEKKNTAMEERQGKRERGKKKERKKESEKDTPVL